jgi:hypothetical protein
MNYYARNLRGKNSTYVRLMLTEFFAQLHRTGIIVNVVPAAAHTAEDTVTALERVSGDGISRGLWATRSPDLTPHDFYLQGNLKNKI